MSLDIGLTLQVLTLLVAAIGPVVAYRYARKLALSGNRQRWVDELRQDVAELIAIADNLAISKARSSYIKDEAKKFEFDQQFADKAEKLQTLRVRIRLRLDSNNPRHSNLMNAINDFVAAVKDDQADRGQLRRVVADTAEKVLQHVWTRIETGR